VDRSIGALLVGKRSRWSSPLSSRTEPLALLSKVVRNWAPVGQGRIRLSITRRLCSTRSDVNGKAARCGNRIVQRGRAGRKSLQQASLARRRITISIMSNHNGGQNEHQKHQEHDPLFFFFFFFLSQSNQRHSRAQPSSAKGQARYGRPRRVKRQYVKPAQRKNETNCDKM
jgi:hypothetical protein